MNTNNDTLNRRFSVRITTMRSSTRSPWPWLMSGSGSACRSREIKLRSEARPSRRAFSCWRTTPTHAIGLCQQPRRSVRKKEAPAVVNSRGQITLQGILAQLVWHGIICAVTSNDINRSNSSPSSRGRGRCSAICSSDGGALILEQAISHCQARVACRAL